VAAVAVVLMGAAVAPMQWLGATFAASRNRRHQVGAEMVPATVRRALRTIGTAGWAGTGWRLQRRVQAVVLTAVFGRMLVVAARAVAVAAVLAALAVVRAGSSKWRTRWPT